MMALVLLSIWTIGFLLIITDKNDLSSRWGGITAFVGGFGFLAGTLDDELRPLLSSSWGTGVHAMANLSSFVCQVGLPYAFLMFAIYSSTLLSARKKKFIGITAAIPIGWMVLITPVMPDLSVDYLMLSTWAIPYILFGSVCFLFHFLKEIDPLVKRNRFIVLVLAVVPILFVMVTIYIFRIFGWYEAWKYNALVIIIQFLLFVLFSLKYGVLGFKLRIEQNRLNTTMRAITSGTAILNHTIKNEVGKMQLLLHRLEQSAVEHPRMSEDIADLQRATEHMLNMVQRMQGKLKDVELKESVRSIEELIKEAIRQVKPFMLTQSIEIAEEYAHDFHVLADHVHLHEVLFNVLRNAIEAMPGQGTIKIRTYLSRKYLTVLIEDNGKGISNGNLAYVFEPFFSTKSYSSSNFGLGLAYCYQVMRKHQGFMEIGSEEGKGTHVFLYLPRKRIKGKQVDKGDVLNETHSSHDC